MSATKYTYSISEDFPYGKVAPDRLTQEITESAITIALDYINTNNDDCDIWFKAPLTNWSSSSSSSSELDILNYIVAHHSGEPLPQPTQDVSITSIDINGATNLPTQIHDFQDLTGYNVYRKGYHFVAEPYAITRQQAKYDQTMKLQGLVFEIGPTARDGDYIEVEMVDADNLFGYGAGLILAKFAETIYVKANMEFSCVCNDAKTLPPGIYVRFSYYSYDPNDDLPSSSSSSSLPEIEGVHVILQHALRTCPAE